MGLLNSNNRIDMNRFFLSFLLLICCISVFSQYKFTLDIKTQTLSNTKISLNIFNNQNFFPVKIHSFFIENGHHILSGEIKQPSNFAAFLASYNGKNIEKNFVLDSGENNISLELPTGDSRSLTLQSDARGHFIFNDLNNLFLETAARYKKPTRVNGYLKIPTELNDQIKRVQLNRLEAYPNDFGSLIYLYRISRTDAMPNSAKNNLATFAKFSTELKNSELGKQLYTEETDLINSKINAGVGNEVKTFTITDINNNLFSNSSLKGQPYIIVFSATWCGPCQLQMPKLKKLYETYKQDGLKVIYFNDDDDLTRWQDHVSKNKLTWINVSEKLKPSVSKIPKSFGVYAIPTCLVINKKGIIVYNSDQSDPSINHIESFVKKAIRN
jgi:thiol-disulfide isomerase/thioredoxin